MLLGRADIPDPLIARAVFLEDIDLTGPATHIDAMALRIDETRRPHRRRYRGRQ